ncbi:type II toxin-antitoxin system YoeB family toxin [Lentilactobacillus fungorum]|uniref:type II toxin-antitoxin system YoeB family toxin n=1 Tax=Lentilactobacillus fungorum TaxID=2201250 RepID=UPI001942FB22
MLANILDSPFSGLQKPEPLNREFSGVSSRRIGPKHRLLDNVTSTTNCLSVASSLLKLEASVVGLAFYFTFGNLKIKHLTNNWGTVKFAVNNFVK